MRASDLCVVSLSLSLASGGGESDGDSAVCDTNCPAFSSAVINPSDSRPSSAELMTLGSSAHLFKTLCVSVKMQKSGLLMDKFSVML